jgi:hypothetical protein
MAEAPGPTQPEVMPRRVPSIFAHEALHEKLRNRALDPMQRSNTCPSSSLVWSSSLVCF